MMKNCILITLLVLFIPMSLKSQEMKENGDTLFNQVDENGLKQGFWKKHYPNGNIRYTGRFLNDRPVGTFKRYYEDQAIQSIMVYRGNQEMAYTLFYYQNGSLAAEGKYIGTKKDSTWKYYSYYGGYLSYQEEYHAGLKDGISYKYFEDGTPSEEMEWKKGRKHGTWKLFYPSGALKMETVFLDDQIHGPFISYNTSGQTEIQGQYRNNLKMGVWSIPDPESGEIKQVKFVDGLPEDQNAIDKEFTELMDQYEKQKGRIPEPDINNFLIEKKK